MATGIQAGIQLSGLSSGLDTQSIIQQLMAVEAQPRQAIADKQSLAQARQDALKAIQGKMNLVRTASDNLSSVLTWSPTQTADTSDQTKATARITGGAGPGGYSLVVSQLASADQRTYAFTSPTADQTVTIDGKQLTITAGSTLDSVVAQINSDTGYGTFAVNANGSLVLASRTTGTAGSINFSDSSGTLVENTAAHKAGRDAMYSIDGASYTSSSNVISTASTTNPTGGSIAGVELTLKGVTDSNGIVVSVSPPAVDKDAVQTAVKGFVDAYNDAMTTMRNYVNEQTVVNPTTASDKVKGVLHADSGVEDMMDQMRNAMIQTFGGIGNPATMDQLQEIGISTGAASGSSTFSQDSVDGKLVIDSTALSNALDTDPLSVQKLLGGQFGTTGFAQTFDSTLDPYTTTNGILDQRIQSTVDSISDYTSQLADMDERLSLKQTQLQTMFTNMETALQKAKDQGSAMMSSLPASTSG